MTIEDLTTADMEVLASTWNEWLADVPHCPPVGVAVIEPGLDGDDCCKAAERLSDSNLWTASERGAVTGVAHIALEANTEQTPRRGVLRFLAYQPGHRRAGQLLLETAESMVREAGASELIAWHYDHTYPWYHAEHACLSGRLDHVHALFGVNGYLPVNGELVLDWPNYAFSLPRAPLPVSLDWQWSEPLPTVDELELVAYHGERQAGICVCIGQTAFQPVREALGWVYIRWLHVERDLRGHGLGRYLVLAALDAYRRRGYRHAVICVMNENYPARLLYTNLGFRTVDWTCAYHKTLS